MAFFDSKWLYSDAARDPGCSLGTRPGKRAVPDHPSRRGEPGGHARPVAVQPLRVEERHLRCDVRPGVVGSRSGDAGPGRAAPFLTTRRIEEDRPDLLRLRGQRPGPTPAHEPAHHPGLRTEPGFLP